MDFIALISGGKDSIYTTNILINQGNKLKGLVYIYCTSESIDSYMYQTVGKEIIEAYSECFGVPLFIKKSKCEAKNTEMIYNPTEDDEVEDLYNFLRDLPVNFEAVSSGAILSSYQKNRVDSICSRLNKHSLAPLFGRNQIDLLKEMILYKIEALVVKVAGIEKDFLLKGLPDLFSFYENKPGMNACGEGGEYETVVVDSPCFVKRIVVLENEVFCHPEEENKQQNTFFAKITKFRIEEK